MGTGQTLRCPHSVADFAGKDVLAHNRQLSILNTQIEAIQHVCHVWIIRAIGNKSPIYNIRYTRQDKTSLISIEGSYFGTCLLFLFHWILYIEKNRWQIFVPVQRIFFLLLSLFSLIFVSINFSLVVLNSKWNSILQLLRLQSWIDSHLIYPLVYWQWFRISKKGILEITCTKRILKKERKVFNSTIDESGCHLVFDLPYFFPNSKILNH